VNWIVDVSPYDETVGGSIVLHKLAHLLEQRGEKAYLTTREKKSGWMGGYVDKLEMQLMEDVVYVAHEDTMVTEFNKRFPFLRWILFTPGVFSGNGVFRPNEMIYLYSRYYKVNPNYKVHGILGVYDFKTGLFVDEHKPRSGECYTVRKGVDKKVGQHTGVRLSRSHKKTDTELKDLFNSCKRFVSYDDVTMLSLFAAMCGCESVVVPGPLPAHEWRLKIPYLRYGIAYGDSQYELDRAKETRGEILPNIERLEKESSQQIDEMVAHVKESLCYSQA
jgi:hypothetical protein